jgi:Maltokinase N-terminal cap domain
MAIIHDTTLNPGKLELLADWLPAQPWYARGGREPALSKAGGFRLDDPQGEVGIEFMVVTDGSGAAAVTYQVPLTYRASALAGCDRGLIGTAEHGVLGRRWIYDGTRDEVLVAQLVALIQGHAQPQAQSLSNTPDPTVIGKPVANIPLTVTDFVVGASGPSGTELRIGTTPSDGTESGHLVVRVNRILQPEGSARPAAKAGPPGLSATWQRPDGSHARGILATAQAVPMPAAP